MLFVVNWEGQKASWFAAIFDAGGILGERLWSFLYSRLTLS